MSSFNMDDYVPVAERVEAFYAKHPDGSLQSELVELTDSRVTVKAYAYRGAGDTRPGIGHSSVEIPGRTPYTKGSEIENAETSAWGRAIASLGFDVKRGIASREEMRNQQPSGGERVARTHGRRSESRQPATTRQAAQNKGQALGQLADVMAEHGMTFAHVDEMAREMGIERGSASVADIGRLIAAIESPSEGRAPLSDGTGEAVSSVPASPTTTASSEGSADPSLPGEGSVSTTPTDAVAVSPAAAASGPTLDDVLTATGGELVPPRPGSDPYKALTPSERAQARAYWAREDSKSLAEALGGMSSD